MGVLKLDDGREIICAEDGGHRGWDAADEYILQSLPDFSHALVIDDTHGALSCGVTGEVSSFSSSILARTLIKDTVVLNNRTINVVEDLNSLPTTCDLIILRLPKFIDLLEYYLQILGERYTGVKIIVGGMAKYMPISMVRLMETYFDNVHTSLTRKKARLIFGEVNSNNTNPNNFPISYRHDENEIYSYPGVFSADHLDIGTRLLLNNLPESLDGDVMDLGAGCGIIGIHAKNSFPEINIHFCDISYFSKLSVEYNLTKHGIKGSFILTDVLDGVEKNSIDHILCNPPFHNGNRVEVDIARRMFKESHRVLKKGGTLTIVANRHLGYHKVLRSIFHNLKRVDENSKFNIFRVRK